MTLAVLALAWGCGDKGGDGDDSADPGSFQVRPAVYAFESSGAEWIAPTGFGDVVPAHPVLVGVQANGPDAVHLTLAWGDGSMSNPRQNLSRRTLDIGAALDSSGHFVFGPEDVDEEGADTRLVIHDLFVSGAITDSAVQNLVLKGTVDGIGAGDAKDVAGFCGLAAEAGALCGPCPDGEQRCVPFEVHQPEALELPDFSLEELATGTWCAGVLVLPIGGTLWRLRRRKATR